MNNSIPTDRSLSPAAWKFIAFTSLVVAGITGWAASQNRPAQQPLAPPTISHLPTPEAPRYRSAGKHEYTNGTKVFVLDSKTGAVCSVFFPAESAAPYFDCVPSADTQMRIADATREYELEQLREKAAKRQSEGDQ